MFEFVRKATLACRILFIGWLVAGLFTAYWLISRGGSDESYLDSHTGPYPIGGDTSAW